MKKLRYISTMLLLLYTMAVGGLCLGKYICAQATTHGHCCSVDHHDHCEAEHHSHKTLSDNCSLCIIKGLDEFQFIITKASTAPICRVLALIGDLCINCSEAISSAAPCSIPKYYDHAPWRIKNPILTPHHSLRAPPVLS